MITDSSTDFRIRQFGRQARGPMRTVRAAAGTLAVLALLSAALSPAPAAGAAELAPLRQFCPTGSAGGQCKGPRGIATDAASGDVYVADQSNQRIEKFGPWGQFLRAWGWDVVQSGPGNDPEGKLEVCVPADGDVCKAGTTGAGVGQVNGPQGVAVDSEGDVYVFDLYNHRVQKFGPAGQFLLMFGGGVDQGGGSPANPGNVCTAQYIANGDACGAGTAGNPGPGEGQFGTPFGASSYIAVHRGTTPSEDTIYVGDQERVQEFDREGHYSAQIPLPGLRVQSLAVSPASGNIYISTCDTPSTAFCSPGALRDGGGVAINPNVLELSPDGAPIAELKAGEPTALAVDAAGNLYVFDYSLAPINEGVPVGAPILKYSPAGALLTSFGAGEFINSTGLAVSSPPTCGLEADDLLASDSGFPPAGQNGPSFVNLYPPPPDPTVCPPPQLAPSIAEQYASAVGSEGATVRAQINPHFWPDTTYFVQYGTGKCSEGGCTEEAPATAIALNAGVVDAPVASKGVFLGAAEALQPDTTYHYRFVAESSGGGPTLGEEASFHTYPTAPAPTTDCPNQPFRAGASALLADCRAYEMVSPVDKNNGDVFAARSFTLPQQSTPGGEGLAYGAHNAFAGPQASALVNQYVARRKSGGWQSHAITAPRANQSLYFGGYTQVPYKLFSADLCDAWLLQDTDVALAPGAPPGFGALYRRSDCGEAAGSFELLSGAEPPPGFDPPAEVGSSTFFLALQGASADGEASVFRADAALTPDASTANPRTFQLYAAFDGQLRLISVLPDAAAAPTHASVGSAEGVTNEIGSNSVYHAVSADAQRVFWTATEASEPPTFANGGNLAGGPGNLYLRENATAPRPQIATGSGDLARSSAEVTNLTTAAGAFESGQRIYGTGIATGTTILSVGPSSLTLSKAAGVSGTGVALRASRECTEAALPCTYEVSGLASKTKPATFLAADPGGERAIFSLKGSSGDDLYEFSAEEEAGALNTHTRRIAGEFMGLMGASADAERLYFASGQNCSGAQQNAQGASAQAGEPNLYLYEAGESCIGRQLTFIATLSDLDASNALTGALPSPVAILPFKRTSRVSPDGLWAAFDSNAAPTGYDSTDAQSGEPDAEVYLYDAQPGGPGSLICASCNPSGTRPTGREVAESGSQSTANLWAAARLPGWTDQLHPGRALSGDGERLFFESFDPLVLRDTNGAGDIYEWERAASKSQCLQEQGGELYVAESGGCISLISSGKSPQDSELIDASADGSDVFFTTASSLLPQDPGLLDVYDARAGGGFPAPPAPPAGCEGEACQSPPPAPQASTPASAAFAGPGNVREAATGRCAKPARRAKALSARAKRLRRGARKLARNGRRARAGALHRRAARSAKQARRQSHRARRCRIRKNRSSK